MSKPVLVSMFLALFRHAAFTASVDVVADNSIVIYRGEEHLNAGSKTRIRIKGNQHLVALRFDVKPLQGKLIQSATLVCYKADKDIEGVTLSTIAAPWDEGKSCALRSGVGAVDGWGWLGARFPAVTGSNSFTLVSQAKSVVKAGKYHWRVDPDLIHANAIGAAYGLTIHETLSVYSRNPTIFSREQRGKEPYLLVAFGGAARKPGLASRLKLKHDGDLNSLRLELTAPSSGFAYEVTVDGKPLPRWNTPFVRPGEKQRIPIRDIELAPGKRVKVTVATLNRVGERSKPATLTARLPRPADAPMPTPVAPPMAEGASPIPVIPVLDKYDANGEPVGDLPRSYLKRNPVFDGQTIRLAAAKGEVVGFQALLTGAGEATVSCKVGDLRVVMRRAVYVSSRKGRVPDPLVPFDTLTLSSKTAAPVVVDVFVPFDCKQKQISGAFEVSDGRSVPIELKVHDFALPKRATFLCEMNSYGLPDRMSAFYQLQEIAYDHRVHCNILYYGHRSAAPGARKCVLDKRLDMGPNATVRRMDEKRFNNIKPGAKTTYWDDFVEAFDAYLTGQHFKHGHRGPVPAPGFYLMFHESWPLNVRAFFNGDPDAYEAFKHKPVYTRTFVNLVKDFIRVAKRQGWTETGFQIYLNNKGKLHDTRKSPWILDEPTAYWDYRALRFYGELLKQAKGKSCPIQLDYRIDISRPQFDRGQLWGVADLWVVNTRAMRQYPRLVRDRMERSGERVWLYGTTNPVEESNRATQAWVLEAYRLGACGIVPWQTIDKGGGAMRRANQLGLFIFDGHKGGKALIRHSIRLKAYRRAEQDIEYLNLMRKRLGLTPAQMRAFIDHYPRLEGHTVTRYAEDAGATRYAKLSPVAFHRLRSAAARVLNGG